LRSKIGTTETDKLVANSILNLAKLKENRSIYWDREEKSGKQVEWYDLVYSLVQIDKILFNGVNEKVICQTFKDSGYEVGWINFKNIHTANTVYSK
ncbi:hypothetical protein N9R81_01220, partial [Flavobacteriales bacterium]|nr:hypothetical protein [Flavobacteriales bacterium]